MRVRAVIAAGVAVLALWGPGAATAGAQQDPTHSEPGGQSPGDAPGKEGKEKLSHEAEECIHLLEEGGKPDDCQEAPSPILPEANEIIYGGLSFLILLALMSKVAYPQLKKGMEARSERIRKDLDEAEQVKNEAQGVLADYQRQVADAKGEAGRIIEEARQTADQLRRDLMQRAEAEVAELRQRTRDEIAAAQARATADLQARVGTLAIELAEKIVEANLDRDKNMRLVESYIAQVGSRG